ncbi:MAG: bifunctional oligoribonuclease/PAP phosphatase NrnA [Bacteroidota bacterium]
MDDITELQNKWSTPTNVVLISHRNPDGDALGSCLALYHFLQSHGHNCTPIVPSEYPSVFSYLPGIERVGVYDNNRAELKSKIKAAELIFCLDFNSLDRIDPLASMIQSSKAYKVVVDHHLDPEPFADWYFSDTAASSTCELVFRLIERISGVQDITLDMATCLFTGILTDTGSFKYATNPEVYRIASELKGIGVDDYSINDYIFNSWTHRQMQILGHSLRDRMEIIPELSCGIIALTQEDYRTYQIGRGDTEGLVNYILMIRGMKVAAFIRHMTSGEIRLSLRSKGDISVQALAREHFGGGGHKNAAGGSSSESLSETIEKFKKVVKFYLA